MRLCAVNGVSSRTTFLEPFKRASISVCDCETESQTTCTWKYLFAPVDSNAQDMRAEWKHEGSTVRSCTYSRFFPLYPGTYTFDVSCNGTRTRGALRSKRVRRNILALTSHEIAVVAKAHRYMHGHTYAEGRARFGPFCPTGRPDDYLDVPGAIQSHLAYTLHPDVPDWHYGGMIDAWHILWMTVVERALQCIEPSYTHPFHDVFEDMALFDAAVEGMDSVVSRSLVWSDAYLSGAQNTINKVYETNDNGYITQGIFANVSREFLFVNRSNDHVRTWCESFQNHTYWRDEYDTCHRMLKRTVGGVRARGNSFSSEPRNNGYNLGGLYRFVGYYPFTYFGSRFCYKQYVQNARQIEASGYARNLVTMFTRAAAMHSSQHKCIFGVSEGPVLTWTTERIRRLLSLQHPWTLTLRNGMDETTIRKLHVITPSTIAIDLPINFAGVPVVLTNFNDADRRVYRAFFWDAPSEVLSCREAISSVDGFAYDPTQAARVLRTCTYTEGGSVYRVVRVAAPSDARADATVPRTAKDLFDYLEASDMNIIMSWIMNAPIEGPHDAYDARPACYGSCTRDGGCPIPSRALRMNCFSANLSSFEHYWRTDARRTLTSGGFLGSAMYVAAMIYPLIVADFFNGTVAAHSPQGSMFPANEAPQFYLTHVYTWMRTLLAMRTAFERRKQQGSPEVRPSDMFFADYAVMRMHMPGGVVLGSKVEIDDMDVTIRNLAPYRHNETVGAPQGLRALLPYILDELEDTFEGSEETFLAIEPSLQPGCAAESACTDAARWMTRCLLRRCVAFTSAFPAAESVIQSLLMSVCDGTLSTRVAEVCTSGALCFASSVLTVGVSRGVAKYFLMRSRCEDRDCDDFVRAVFPFLRLAGFDHSCFVSTVAV
jgi:hypothetical protein